MNMSSKYFSLFLLIIIQSNCRLNTDNKTPTVPVTTNNTNLIPTNGIFHKDQINEQLIIVFDTTNIDNACSWNNIDAGDIIGYTTQKNINLQALKYLQPSTIKNGPERRKRKIYKIKNDDCLLVMSCDDDTSIMTKWDHIENDSFKFISSYSPNIDTKNSNLRILEHVEINNKIFLINKISGSIDSEDFEALYVAQVTDKELKYIAKINIEYSHENGDWAHLSYSINGNIIEVTEHRNKMQLDGSTWKTKGNKNTLVKKIILD